MITKAATGTRVDEIASGIYRISTPVTHVCGGFSYNRYLVVDEAPLLYHTGPRGMFEETSPGPMAPRAPAEVSRRR
jgi:hypothetical protein